MTEERVKEIGEFLKNSTKRQAAIHFNCSFSTIDRICYKYGFKANPEAIKEAIISGSKKGNKRKIELHDYNGSNNPNWKNGISKNNYHYKKLQEQRYPERVKARRTVGKAVKKGTLIKCPCSICNDPVSFAHHEDYSKPLDVIWLCRKHHREVHNNRY